MIAWFKRLMNRVAFILWLLMLADFLHTASHYPFNCDEDCPWPWGKRMPGRGLLGGADE